MSARAPALALAPGSALALALGSALALTLHPGAAAAQALTFDAELAPPAFARPPVAAERYVAIHVAENRLYVIDRERVIWTVPVATGTGFRLEGRGRRYDFDTPRGLFAVQHKETDPIWQKPDWYFIENGLPIPPRDSPLRRGVGMLGTTAIYIGYQLALHGTERPDLILRPDPEERRVSHGCIRLTNEDARTLYHLVDLGTPVLIY